MAGSGLLACAAASPATDGGMPGLTSLTSLALEVTGVGSLTGSTRSNGLSTGRKAPWGSAPSPRVPGRGATRSEFVALRGNICIAIGMPSPPWTRDVGISAVVERWLASNTVRPCFCSDETLIGNAGRYAPIPSSLPEGLASALAQRGITHLYSHQARAI